MVASLIAALLANPQLLAAVVGGLVTVLGVAFRLIFKAKAQKAEANLLAAVKLAHMAASAIAPHTKTSVDDHVARALGLLVQAMEPQGGLKPIEEAKAKALFEQLVAEGQGQ